jgi:hypothetical protein
MRCRAVRGVIPWADEKKKKIIEKCFFFMFFSFVWGMRVCIRQFHNEHTQLQAQWQRKTSQSSLPKSCADCVLLFDDEKKFPDVCWDGNAKKKFSPKFANLLGVGVAASS